MNFKLAREIYGAAWFVDPVTFTQLSKTLELVREGSLSDKGEKSNSFGIIDKTNVYSARKITRMEAVPPETIAVYNFDSVITKYGGMSHYGTVEIAAQFKEMESNENVIGHIFFIESGGGSANAIKYIRDVTNKETRSKPLITYAEDIMASAAMYIASDSDYIFANSNDALIGSIGTMIQLEGYKSGEEDKTGKRHLRIYASQSINKNKEFEDAINEFDYTLIKKTLLDPHCAEFISDMEQNRPNITDEQKTGAIYSADKCIGTLIDEIGTFEMAINKVNEFNNQKKKIMNIDELKASHPELYAQVFNKGKSDGLTEGVKSEKNRVDTWMVFNDVNPEKVKNGIESGEIMSEAEKLTFLRESQTKAMQNGLETESAQDLIPDKETAKVKTEAQKEDASFDTALENAGIEKEDK